MSRMESGIIGPLQGWLVKKIGPRMVIQIGVIILALGFILFSKIDSILDTIKNKIEKKEAITTEDFEKVFDKNVSPN